MIYLLKALFAIFLAAPFYLICEYSFSMRDQFAYSYVISIFFLFIFLCVLYPIANFIWRAIFRDSLHAVTYFLCATAFFSFFAFSSLHLDSKFIETHYVQRYGNCLFFNSWWIKKGSAQKTLQNMLSTTPSFIQRIANNIEDHCRYEKLNYLFTLEKEPLPQMCQNYTAQDKYLCFSSIRSKINQKVPYSEYGYIKSQVVAAKLLSKDPHNQYASEDFGPKNSNFLMKLMGYDRMLQILESRMYLKLEKLMNPDSNFHEEDIQFSYQKDVLTPLFEEHRESFEKYSPKKYYKALKEKFSSLMPSRNNLEEKSQPNQNSETSLIEKQLREINQLLKYSKKKLSDRQKELLENFREKYKILLKQFNRPEHSNPEEK